MLRMIAVTGLLLTVSVPEFSQTAPVETVPMDFEVASIKPYIPPQPQAGKRTAVGRRGGPGTNDPGQVTWNGASLKSLLMMAYALKSYQVSGPAWLDTERFDIVAKVPAGASKEQALVMWQRLLADRFQLKSHRETKDIPVYELTIGKNGPKLKESAPDPPKPPAQGAEGAPPPPPPRSGPLTMGPDGCPVGPDGRKGTSMMMMPGKFSMCASGVTIESLTMMLGGQLDRPVFDKTGLKGKYDFKLEFLPEGAMGRMGPAGGTGVTSAAQAGPAPDGSSTPLSANLETAPPIAAAFQSQLGLKLEAKKAPAEILIVDKMEKTPTEN